MPFPRSSDWRLLPGALYRLVCNKDLWDPFGGLDHDKYNRRRDDVKHLLEAYADATIDVSYFEHEVNVVLQQLEMSKNEARLAQEMRDQCTMLIDVLTIYKHSKEYLHQLDRKMPELTSERSRLPATTLRGIEDMHIRAGKDLIIRVRKEKEDCLLHMQTLLGGGCPMQLRRADRAGYESSEHGILHTTSAVSTSAAPGSSSLLGKTQQTSLCATLCSQAFLCFVSSFHPQLDLVQQTAFRPTSPQLPPADRKRPQLSHRMVTM